MRNFWKLGLTASLIVSVCAMLPRRVEAISPPAAAPAFDGSLAVLTYNVKGLPWPIARGRADAFDRIAARLRALRAQRKAPQVVVLQETFTDDAQAIGAAAGYRYAVRGPSADEAGSPAMAKPDRAFAAAGHWWYGETQGKFVGSGLQVLSDYPIVAVHRMAFPSFACAGFDCLANKGAVLVTLAIPGAATPVDVVTAHLNSRKASRVDDARSNYAYRRQVEALTAFIRTAHDRKFPLIVSGDFNVGSVPARRSALLTSAHTLWSPQAAVRDALNQFRRQGGALEPDAAFSLGRARDWQFYSDGSGGRLTLTGIDVPFGHEKSGDMLSDHVGYIARFRLDGSPGEAVAGATSFARSKA